MNTLIRTGAALSLVALASTTAGADELVFRPTTPLAKSVTVEQYAFLDELMIVIDGKPQAAEPYFELATTQSLQITDRYGEVRDGRPSWVHRSFGAAQFNGAAELPAGSAGRRETRSLDAVCPLEGKSVVFMANGDGYGAFYDGASAEEETLAHLSEDIDFRALLPAGPVADGDSWALAPGSLRSILSAGGDLDYRVRSKDQDSFLRIITTGVGGSLDLLFSNNVSGEARATYRGQREVNGATVGVIEFTFSIALAREHAEEARRKLRAEERALDVQVEMFLTDSQLEGRGELLWDIAGGHAHSLSVSGNGRLERRTRYSSMTQMKRSKLERDFGLTTQFTVKASIAPASE